MPLSLYSTGFWSDRLQNSKTSLFRVLENTGVIVQTYTTGGAKVFLCFGTTVT